MSSTSRPAGRAFQRRDPARRVDHLDREFRRVVGLGPRTLARILRTRHLLERLDLHGDPSWSDLAAEGGWFDQSHLIRDFRLHTGVTPSEYVEAQRRFFQPDDVAPGFVPVDAAL